jgi:hypothetical protein
MRQYTLVIGILCLVFGCINADHNQTNLSENRTNLTIEQDISKSNQSEINSSVLIPETNSSSYTTNQTENQEQDSSLQIDNRTSIWIPKPNSSFQWQLDGDIDTSIDAEIYDIDLFDTDQKVIEELHEKGKKVICYMSAGSLEDWREDADNFPDQVIGKKYEGWEGENWLDIRKIDLLAPIMSKRLDLAVEKGCDAIEPDNIDVYDNDNGFSITYQDQLDYNIWLANETHKRGMSIGLKNDPEQAQDLEQYFDWALLEDCYVDGWCDQMLIFSNNKAVFQVEYTDSVELNEFCDEAKHNGFVGILKNRELDSWIRNCS